MESDSAIDAAGPAGASAITVAVDGMGGDRGPAAVVGGVARAAAENPDVHFLLVGDEAVLAPLLRRRRALAGRVTLRHAPGVISMNDRPSQVVRSGRDSSMWAVIEAVRTGEARAAVSCGNTGALMAMSAIRLGRLPGVARPAIAILWPSRGPAGYNVVLDAGADVKADPRDLLTYGLMGASYARNGLDLARPRVGLLNIGTEDHKGRPELHEAARMMAGAAEAGGYEWVGYVEGSDIPSSRVDVIVTDGFTGNVALKTAEGTARLISELMAEAFRKTPLSRIAALLAWTSLRRLRMRIDPRRVNGGVFLGLAGRVVKSHGAADA
ncbi:MAG: phosphate acyltransferase PlsX, partial [Alphaproteobacteria bacterium]